MGQFFAILVEKTFISGTACTFALKFVTQECIDDHSLMCSNCGEIFRFVFVGIFFAGFGQKNCFSQIFQYCAELI